MQSIVVVDISVMVHRQIPMVVEFLQLQYIDKVVDVGCAGVVARPLCATTDAHGRCPHAVHRLGRRSLCCCSDQFQLSASTAGMMGRFFSALHAGAGPGVVSTGTRPP